MTCRIGIVDLVAGTAVVTTGIVTPTTGITTLESGFAMLARESAARWR
jgi:hypothetical protein